MKFEILRAGTRPRRHHRGLATGLALWIGVAATAHAQISACDLDQSGSVNVVDVNRAVSMALGTTPCTANVEALSTCTIITVQRVVNSALGQPCVTYSASVYAVSTVWQPSPSAGVAGYNVYRRTTPTGTYSKLNTTVVSTTSYTDNSVQLGQTYYYAIKAVDASGNESTFSNETTAAVPAT